MAKTYRTPAVTSLGVAEVLTSGLTAGPLSELGSGKFIRTTHAVLDL